MIDVTSSYISSIAPRVSKTFNCSYEVCNKYINIKPHADLHSMSLSDEIIITSDSILVEDISAATSITILLS